MTTTPEAKRQALAANLAAHPGNSCIVQCARTHDTEAKRFATLQARFAQTGHALRQSGPGDGPGPVSYLAERWGLARYLPTLAETEKFLIQVGGAHGL